MYLFDVSALHRLSGTNTPDLFLSSQCIFCSILSHVFLLHYIFPVLLLLCLGHCLGSFPSQLHIRHFFSIQSSFLQCAHIILFSNSSLYFKIPKVFSIFYSTLCFLSSALPKYCIAAAVRLLTSTIAHSTGVTQLACRTCGVEW